MKKRTSTIIKVGVGVAVVAAAGIMIKNYIGNKVEKVSDSAYHAYTEVPVTKMDLETYTRGTGLFVSFNTGQLKVDENKKISKRFVNDGDAVTVNQNIFQLSDGYESTYLKAPIAGLFFERQAEGSPTSYEVYDTTNTGVMIQVAEENVAKLQVGQPAKVKVTAINKELDGQVSYISKVAENGNFPVRISIPYRDDLRFGYNASVKIVTASSKDALCVPYNAVMFEGDKAYVIDAKYKKELNKTYQVEEKMKIYIEIGASDSDYVEIKEGLKEHDQILMENYQ